MMHDQAPSALSLGSPMGEGASLLDMYHGFLTPRLAGHAVRCEEGRVQAPGSMMHDLGLSAVPLGRATSRRKTAGILDIFQGFPTPRSAGRLVQHDEKRAARQAPSLE